MSPDDILEIIDNLPQFVVYIYPGAITIYLYLFFRTKKIEENKGMIIKSIVISYVYITIMNNFIKPKNELNKNIELIIISVVIAYLSYRFIESKVIAKILMEIKIYTAINDSPIELLRESKEDKTYLCIYIDDSPNLIIEGFLKEYETEKDKESFVILSQYAIKEWNRQEWNKVKDYFGEDEEKVLVFLKDIARIEKRDLINVQEEIKKEECKRCIEKMHLGKVK